MIENEITEAPEYLPHLIMQCITENNCCGELTPSRKVNIWNQPTWIYTCDECQEEFTQEEILEVLNDYEFQI